MEKVQMYFSDVSSASLPRTQQDLLKIPLTMKNTILVIHKLNITA
jgi:hypothetical protein